jgi:hypothetical protein
MILWMSALVTVFTLRGAWHHYTAQAINPPSPVTLSFATDTTHVGHYVTLEGLSLDSSSVRKPRFHWSEDPSNPKRVTFDPGIARPEIGFPSEGNYTFSAVVIDGADTIARRYVAVKVYPCSGSGFQDPNLEISVRFALRVPSGPISDSLLLTLDSLRAYSPANRVRSLKGLERCHNLRLLDLNNQNVSDLSPIRDLHNLEYLGLRQNERITDIGSLARMRKLQTLNLQMNCVENIECLVHLKNLRVLNIMENPLRSIGTIGRLVQLEELWIGHLPLHSIAVLSSLVRLKGLWLSTCQVSDITPLSHLKRLRWACLAYNCIRDMRPLSSLRSIEWLDLGYNQIRELVPLASHEKLSQLNLQNNLIEDIHILAHSSKFPKGARIILTGNPLKEASIRIDVPDLESGGIDIVWQ